LPDGRPEGFLRFKNGSPEPAASIGSNPKLVNYLLTNRGYQIVQHGYNHDYLEFDRDSAPEISRRLDRGKTLLLDAGFPAPEAFVAPYDKLSRASLAAVAARFKVLSTGWFELRRLPYSWWPN
jgi:predicted deacetylase